MPSSKKLGKLAPVRSLRSLPLSNYLNPSTLAFPAVKAWERPLDWKMFQNDKLGCCTIAAAAHMQMAWNAVANAGSPTVITDEQIIKEYSVVSGYDPATGANDNGAVELDVLNRWSTQGLFGLRIDGFATLDVQNIDHIKAAIYLFGGVYIGFQVPEFIMEQISHTWGTALGNATIVGGHAVCLTGYGRAGASLVSWGDLYHMTWPFWQQYVDEAYAVVSKNWIKASGVSPSGLDLNGLLADLRAA